MSTEQFISLVEENDGFEFCQAYRDDEDHFIGGKNNTYWYVICKKSKIKESYIATHNNGKWKDTCTKVRGGKKSMKDLPEGSIIKMIAEKAYLLQDQNWVINRKGRLIEDSHPHYHYTYGFGEKALDISEKYGVTIAYSDINDVSSGFHLRDLIVGPDVELPE